MPKPWTMWITTNCGNFWKRWEYQTTWPAPWEICMQVKRQQLELGMEQHTGSKLGKEYIKAVYCHPAYLTSMQREGHFHSGLENPVNGGAWWAAVNGVAKSRTRLSNFTFTFHFHALEKEMATYASVLVWRIPGTGEPGGLPSMGSHRVGHDWSDLAAAAAPESGFPF